MKPHKCPERLVLVTVLWRSNRHMVGLGSSIVHTHSLLGQHKDNVNGKPMWSVFCLHILPVSSFGADRTLFSTERSRKTDKDKHQNPFLTQPSMDPCRKRQCRPHHFSLREKAKVTSMSSHGRVHEEIGFENTEAHI